MFASLIFVFTVSSLMICSSYAENIASSPECGLTTQHRQLEGTSSNHLELPWHAVIYQKTPELNYQKCGGSLITATKVISVAYWFYDYNDEFLPNPSPSDFVVAVNKMYRPYNDSRDKNSQYSDVVDFIMPSSYRGGLPYDGNNIAIVVVKTPFFFSLSVRPVCLDFDNDLDSTQMTDGYSGKAARWNVGVSRDQLSQVLHVVDFPYMKNADCDTIWPTNKRQNLTKDKLCTRYNDGMWSDIADTGSGLAILDSTTQRYFLRGVLSDYLVVDGRITIIYTSIVKHEHFIKQHL